MSSGSYNEFAGQSGSAQVLTGSVPVFASPFSKTLLDEEDAEGWLNGLGLGAGGPFQPLDATLTALAAVTFAADKGLYSTASDAFATFDLTAFARTILDDADAAAVRSTLGLVIGTDVLAPSGSGASLTALNATQLASGTIPDARFPATLPALSGANLTNLNATNLASGTVPNARLDAELSAIAGLTSAADQVPYFTGSGTASLATLTSQARSFLSQANTNAQRLSLELGTIATQDSDDVSISGGTISDVDLTADGSGLTGLLSSAVTFTQTGTGAVARSADNKFKEEVSVKDFGAVGDDSTDDTAAIQLAYDTGKSVFWPESTYKITASIKPKGHGQVSRGAGMRRTIIKQYTAGAHAFELVAISPAIHGGEAYGLKWMDMTVLGPGTFNTGTAAFSGSTGDGFHMSRPSATTYFTDHISIENVDCEQWLNCTYFAGIANVSLIHCQFGYADRAVKLEGSTGNSFHSIKLTTSNCATNNIYLGAGVGYVLTLADTNVTAAIGSCTQLETATGVIATVIGGNFEGRSATGNVVKTAANSTLTMVGSYLVRGSGTDSTAIDNAGQITMISVTISGYTTPRGGAGKYICPGPTHLTTSGGAYAGFGHHSPLYPLDVVAATGSQVRIGTGSANSGGFLWSGNTNQLWMSGGGYHDGSHRAAATTVSSVWCASGQIEFYANSGLTAGNTYTPTLKAYFTPTKFMRRVVGSTDAGIGGTLPVDTTQTGNVGTGEDTLQSATVTGGLLANNGETYEFTCAGTIANNANAKRIRAKFGATTIFDSGALPTSAAIEWSLNCKVIRTGAATQKCISVLSTNNATAPSVVDYATAAETLSGNVTTLVTGEAVDNNDIVKELYIPDFKAQ